ncbi:MAG: hypothetical protein ACP6KW_05760 [Candidatus Thorarchaeota archaeon]
MNCRLRWIISFAAALLLLTPVIALSSSPASRFSSVDPTPTVRLSSSYAVQRPLSRVAIVASDPDSFVDDFAYIATVPTGVFYDNGTQYVSPVVFSSGSDSEMWFVEDWAQYLETDGGITQGMVVGDIPQPLLVDLQDTLGTRLYPRITGSTAAEIAAKLAVSEWASSGTAVVALASDTFTQPSTESGSATHTLSGRESSTESFSGSASFGAPTSNNFTPPNWAVWMHGQFNWSGSEIMTHELISPSGEVVDYSVYTQMYFSRNPAYVSSPVPMQFWLPVTEYGVWTMNVTSDQTHTTALDCKVTYHPGYRHTIDVPADARSLDIELRWDNVATDLNLALIDPNGRMVMWAPAGSILSNPGLESISLPYPMPGEWTAIAGWMDSTTETNNIELSWDISRFPENLGSYLESAANGAVLASLLNAPLLYASASDVPSVTEWALERLGVSSVVLVDPADIHQTSLLTELSGLASLLTIDTYSSLSGNITEISKSPDVVVSVPVGTGDEFMAPAAYSAAVHGSPIFSLCGDDNVMTTRAQETWAPYLIGPEINNIYVVNKYENRAENGWYDERIPNRFSMMESVDSFEGFLSLRGAYNATAPQPVVVVAPVTLIPTSFDRSLQSHFQSGRIPAETADLASVLINRGLLHRYIYLTAQSADTALVSMYAYTDGATFIDNNYDYYTLTQIENSTDALESAGFDIEYHVGLDAVVSSIQSQVALWTLSTHGTLTLLPRDPPDRPNGPGFFSMRTADAKWGFEISESERENPGDSDKLVNPVAYQSELQYHTTESTDEFEANLGDIGSPIVIVTACLLGGSELPLMMMRHGAVAVTASPRTVYFQPAGMLSVLLTQHLCDGLTTGEALSQGLSLISSDYSNPLDDRDPRDYANQQILFGDPSVKLYDPSVDVHVPAVDPLSTSFGEHTPGLGVNPVAALGVTDYLPQSLQAIGAQFDYYQDTNFSEFVSLLSLRTVTIVEPGAVSVYASNLTAHSEEVRTFVESGGVLAVIGVDDDMAWLPWPVDYTSSGGGSSVTITDSQHPLLTNPNTLNSTMDYGGYFAQVWSNLTILATDGSHPVFAAGSAGCGKVAVTTINPTDGVRDPFIENLVSWSEVPSIRLRSISLSQQIIWAGDQLVITLELTDMVGNPIESASVSAFLNSSAVATTDLGDGFYTITLDGQWTSANVGDFDLLVHASLAGYDTLTLYLENVFTVRPFPWVMLGVLGGGVAVAVGGYLYLKRRSGSRILRDDSSKMTKRERERQEKKDTKVDPKEYFGV